MTDNLPASRFPPGAALEWTPAVRDSENFPRYVALIGEGPFTHYELTYISPKPPTYGDERFRDGMRVPEKLLTNDARIDEARQVGDRQRVKIHVVDSEGHHVSAEFPAYFFQTVTRMV